MHTSCFLWLSSSLGLPLLGFSPLKASTMKVTRRPVLVSVPSSPLMCSSSGFAFTVQALMGIKASLKDPHSVLENWDQNSVDPCSWTMVTCSSENLVIGL